MALIQEPPACAECGSDPVHHGSTYATVAIDGLMRPFVASGTAVSTLMSGIISGIEDAIGPAMVDGMLAVGWGILREHSDEKTMLLAQMLWKEAGERGISMREFRPFGLPRNLFLAEFPSGRRIAFEGIPTPPSGVTRVWWMDDKAVLKRKFKKSGFPVADGGSAFTLHTAQQIFRRLVPPVIVKPHSGSGSRHTTLHIAEERELERAFRVAKQLAPFAVVEEELVGPVYRATVVDGVFVASLRRDQPQVVGNGKHNVTELVAEANRHPARGGPYFSPIRLNEAGLAELAWQGLAPESVPENGRRVMLHQKVNWSVGGTTTDVTDETHSDNRELFEAVAKALRSPIVGIDFIITDMARSWKKEPRAGIIECNSMPFFDNHHLPFEGKPRNVAAAIWDMVS